LLRETAAIIFRWKWEILSVFALIIVLTTISVYLAKPQFESQAMILIVPGRDKRPFIPDQNTSNIQTYFQVNTEDMANEIQIIQSYPVLKAVADKIPMVDGPGKNPGIMTRFVDAVLMSAKKALVALGLKRPDLPPEEIAVQTLRKGLHVDFVKRTAVITVSYRAKTPQRACEIVNTIVDAYIAHHLKIYSNAGAASAIRFISEDFKGQLREKEDSLKEFKTRKGVIDADLENQSLEKKLTEARSKLLLLERININQISTADLANLSDDPAFSQLQTRLTDAELKYLELSSRYGKEEGKVVAAAKEISEIKQFIGKRIKVSIDTWNQLVAQYQDRFEHLEQSSVRITRLEREIQAIKDAIQISAQKSNEMTINSYLDNAAISSIRVVQYGQESMQPASPKRMKSIFMAILIGAFIGVLYGFLRNRLSPFLFSVSDIETSVHKPVFASIQNLSTGSLPALEAAHTAASRILAPVADHIRKHSPQSLSLITTPSNGGGNSFVAAALSISLASSSGAGVLCIEIASPALKFLADRSYSLSANKEPVSSDIGDKIIPGAFKGVDVLKVAIRSSSLPNQEIIAQFISKVKELGYSNIVIDISAHGADPLYLSFAGHVSSIFLTVAYGKTNRYSLARMINLLERYGHKVDGCILNRRVNEIPEALYQWL
jgi:succinoglycan biosynthesis transport protein ExoP